MVQEQGCPRFWMMWDVMTSMAWCPWLAQVINTRLGNGTPELWEQAVDLDTKQVLRPGHYVVDRKQQRVTLTTEGMHCVLRRLGVWATSLPV